MTKGKWSDEARKRQSKAMRKMHKMRGAKQRTLFKLFGYTILIKKDN
jgi:hypothetical protein|tara:strand:- start:6140 stop:6280 length:141 start_codon:yes stop_codon:yes gene_type:complete